MKILKALLLSGLLFLVVSPRFVWGDCPKNACENIGDPAEKVICLEEVTKKCASQRVDLTSQIAYMDAQIRLTTSKIAGTEIKIAQLAEEIEALSDKIDRLEGSLADLSNVLIERIVATYKQGDIEPIFLLLSSNGFSDFLTKFKYIKIVQAHDKRLMFQMQETKDNYTDQKTLREQKKQEQEILRRQLESQKATLAQQQKDKKTLLEVTKSDERRYQQLLEEARAEQAVVLGLGKETFLRDVSEGDTIGKIISTASGCSSGPHLHFEIHKDNNVQDPNNFLKQVSFSYSYGQEQYGYYGRIDPHGSWNWPMDEQIEINQGFGSTGFARDFGYAGGVHNGIDMDSKSSSNVKAVKQGKLYGGSYQCTGSYPGTLLYAKLEQADGIVTWYLHMIPQ